MVASRVPLDQVLSKIGLGWFHARLWWISGFGFSAAAVEVVVMSFVFPELRNGPWQLSEYQLGALVTVIGCGSIFGEMTFGCIADMYGRRNVFIASAMLVVVFGVASAFAQDIYWLAGLRFFVGFGYGGNIAVDFTLYSEFLPTEGRGQMLFWLTAFWPIGQIFASLMAWVLIPPQGWRVFMAASAIPSFITCFARPFIPESPRWLLTQGRAEEAAQICRDIAELNGKTPNEVGLFASCELCLDNEHTFIESPDEVTDKAASVSISKFFAPDLWKTTLGLLIVVGALNYTGYGTLTLMPTLLERKGVAQPEMYKSMVLNSSAQIPGILLAAYAATHLGRLASLRTAMFLCGLSLFGFAIVHKQGNMMMFTMLASCFLESGWALFHVYVAEVYPTDSRALGIGFISAAGSIVAISGPLVSAALLENKNVLYITLFFASVATFAGVSACFLLHIETKDRDLRDSSFDAPARAASKMM